MRPFFQRRPLSVSMLLSNNTPSNTKFSQVSPRFSLYILLHVTFVFACSSGEKPERSVNQESHG